MLRKVRQGDGAGSGAELLEVRRLHYLLAFKHVRWSAQLARVSKCFACIGLVIRTMLLVGADRPLVCGFQPPPQPPGLLPRRQLDRSEKESP